ncbi:MAG TPA: phosphoribosyl-AMP cyclohydrolase [Hyphomicrobiaceae bacterium]|nr:phosphoribosyl-AMP cyclohydrolase [Hyphomicrobiaceae bacterium]
MPDSAPFNARGSKLDVEEGAEFQPLFDAAGLIPAIVTDVETGEVLMFAWMNSEALAKTIQTRTACFWSRSRNKLWQKGEESGNTLTVHEIRTDCDQDVLWISTSIEGAGVACHTKRHSCFYRALDTSARDTPPRLRMLTAPKS